MKILSRREFLKIGAYLATGWGLANSFTPLFAKGLEKLSQGSLKIVWLQAQSCTGCTVSLLNSNDPYIQDVILNFISIMYHPTLSVIQGDEVVKLLNRLITSKTSYVLIIEGSIPIKMPKACIIGNKTFEDVAIPFLKNAKYILAIGSCAAYGGVPSAEGNLTGAVSVKEFMELKEIPYENRLINCPLCPTHPSSIIGTLAYVASMGYPEVDKKLLTPKMFYSHSVHYNCPQYHFYEKGIFAQKFGDNGCLFKLGCLGPLSYTNCPWRQWNGGVNWCIRAAAPCIGCSHPSFAKYRDFPFYRKAEKYYKVNYNEEDRKN